MSRDYIKFPSLRVAQTSLTSKRKGRRRAALVVDEVADVLRDPERHRREELGGRRIGEPGAKLIFTENDTYPPALIRRQ